MTKQATDTPQVEPGKDRSLANEAFVQTCHVGIVELLTQIVRRKAVLASIMALSTAIGIALCLALPARYTATTKIMPPQQSQSAASLMMNQLANSIPPPAIGFAGGGMAQKSPNDLYVGLLSSRPVADALIQNFNLMQVYHSRDITASREELAANTIISSDKSGFISVSVTDKNSTRAAEITNGYSEQLRALTRRLAVSEASQRRLFYEEQLRQAKESLAQAEDEFRNIQQQKGLVQLDEQAKSVIVGLADLRTKVAAKRVEVQALESYSTDRNPEVGLALSQLHSLQSEERRMTAQDESAKSRNVGLEQLPSAGLEYLRADHEMRYRQAVFDMLLKQLDAAKMDEAKEAAIIQVVEPALVPERKSSPHRLSIMIVCEILGFISSCILISVQWLLAVASLDPRVVKRLAPLREALFGINDPKEAISHREDQRACQ